jgi:DNA (cytosine-5)-methyltransferase 1
MASGFETVAFCETDEYCRKVLTKHWPGRPIYGDIRELTGERLEPNGILPVELVCGGDPCPIRSRARGSQPTKHADLAGYFLALVGGVRPRWVVRENVPAPDVADFALGLECLRYTTVVVELRAEPFTGQSRRREFVVACSEDRLPAFESALSVNENASEDATATEGQKATAYCLTAHPRRLAAEENYVLEGRYGLRSLSAEERERLQGFPIGWTEGFSWSRRAIMIGKAVVPQVVACIGRAIQEAENAENGKGKKL